MEALVEIDGVLPGNHLFLSSFSLLHHCLASLSLSLTPYLQKTKKYSLKINKIQSVFNTKSIINTKPIDYNDNPSMCVHVCVSEIEIQREMNLRVLKSVEQRKKTEALKKKLTDEENKNPNTIPFGLPVFLF